MENERLEVGALLQRIWATISAAPMAVIVFVVALSAFGSFADIYTNEGSGGILLISIADFVASYFLIRAMLRGCGLMGEGEGGGFGAYFMVCFLGGLGMLLGFVLLIIPGVILMVRWSAAFAAVVNDDEGPNGALSTSWDMTRGNFWPIFAASLVGLIPMFVLYVGLEVGLAFSEATPGNAYWAEIIASNVVGKFYSIFSSALGIAVYWMLRGDQRGISEVFA